MDTKTALTNYLGAGLSQAQAAAAAGVSEGYVSQLLSTDPEFASAVATKKAVRAERYLEMDELADTTQHVALQRLSKVVALETRASVLLNAINTLDKMQRRAAPAQQADNGTAGLVVLNLPAVAAQRYTISVDTANRVISVDAHTMVPASGAQIAQMAEVVSAEAEGRNNERRAEAGVLQIPTSGTGGPEAYGAVSAPAGACTGATSGTGRKDRSPNAPLLNPAYDGTVGSLL